jgi:hypothetical protein
LLVAEEKWAVPWIYYGCAHEEACVCWDKWI